MITKQIIPVLILLIVISGLLFGYQQLLYVNNSSNAFKFEFAMVVNLMLFLMSLVNMIRIHKVDKTNPNAMVRSVILGTLFKMIVIIGAAMVYVKQSKLPVGMINLLVSFGIYIAYTWLEIKGALKK